MTKGEKTEGASSPEGGGRGERQTRGGEGKTRWCAYKKMGGGSEIPSGRKYTEGPEAKLAETGKPRIVPKGAGLVAYIRILFHEKGGAGGV